MASASGTPTGWPLVRMATPTPASGSTRTCVAAPSMNAPEWLKEVALIALVKPVSREYLGSRDTTPQQGRSGPGVTPPFLRAEMAGEERCHCLHRLIALRCR